MTAYRLGFINDGFTFVYIWEAFGAHQLGLMNDGFALQLGGFWVQPRLRGIFWINRYYDGFFTCVIGRLLGCTLFEKKNIRFTCISGTRYFSVAHELWDAFKRSILR